LHDIFIDFRQLIIDFAAKFAQLDRRSPANPASVFEDRGSIRLIFPLV